MLFLQLNTSRGLVTAALLSGAVVLFAGCGSEDSVQREAALAKARRENPVEAVKHELDDRINRYRQRVFGALPFLSVRATNISLVRVTRSRNECLSTAVPVLLADSKYHYLELSPGNYLDLSSRATNISLGRVTRSGNTNLSSADAVLLGNTNLPSVVAVLLVDGKYHYLEIPVSIFPTLFIETLPPPPSEAEIREHISQQVQRVLKGEKSDLNLSSYYQWTNIVIESVTVPTNNTRTYPYRTEVVLFVEASGPNTGRPLQSRLRLEIDNGGEDWLVFPKQGAP